MLSKGKSKTCKADAMRLSRNLAYMLAQFKPGNENCTFEQFCIAAQAAFEKREGIRATEENKRQIYQSEQDEACTTNG
jgi:hypothetical protein